MIRVDLQVMHKSFGLGVITAINGKYITVKFEGCEKNFVYPDAFEKFLTLADGTVSADILADLESSKRAKAVIKEKKDLENIRSKHGIVIPGKEITSDTDDEDSSKNGENDEN